MKGRHDIAELWVMALLLENQKFPSLAVGEGNARTVMPRWPIGWGTSNSNTTRHDQLGGDGSSAPRFGNYSLWNRRLSFVHPEQATCLWQERNETGDIGPLRPTSAHALYQGTTFSRAEKQPQRRSLAPVRAYKHILYLLRGRTEFSLMRGRQGHN